MADDLKLEATPYAWAVGLEVFKTFAQAAANLRNPDLMPEPLYRRAAPSSPVADDGREGAAQTGPKSAETRIDAGSQVLFAVADYGLPPVVAPKGPFADYSAEEVESYARQVQREAVAILKAAWEAEAKLGEAYKQMAWEGARQVAAGNSRFISINEEVDFQVAMIEVLCAAKSGQSVIAQSNKLQALTDVIDAWAARRAAPQPSKDKP